MLFFQKRETFGLKFKGWIYIDLLFYERESDENPKKAQLWYKDFVQDVCICVFITSCEPPFPCILSDLLVIDFFSSPLSFSAV